MKKITFIFLIIFLNTFVSNNLAYATAPDNAPLPEIKFSDLKTAINDKLGNKLDLIKASIDSSIAQKSDDSAKDVPDLYKPSQDLEKNRVDLQKQIRDLIQSKNKDLLPSYLTETQNAYYPSGPLTAAINAMSLEYENNQTNYLPPENIAEDKFNAEAFLSPMTFYAKTNYAPEKRTEAAASFLKYITNIAPSAYVLFLHRDMKAPGLTIAFDPDKGNPNLEESVPKYIEPENKDKNAENSANKVVGELSAQPAYLNYLTKIYSYTTIRSLLLNNLWSSFVKRYIDKNKNKSIADIDREMAYKRLSPEYIQELKSANSISVQRETVLLLAEMNRRLYELQETNERLLITDTINDLLQLRLSRSDMDQLSMRLSRYADCRFKNTSKDECLKNMNGLAAK